jgi:uncharacterized protein YciW
VIPQGQENLLSGAIEFFPAGVGWKGEDIAIVRYLLLVIGYQLLIISGLTTNN